MFLHKEIFRIFSHLCKYWLNLFLKNGIYIKCKLFTVEESLLKKYTQLWNLYLNPVQTNVLTVYPLKTSYNIWFSEVFTRYLEQTLISLTLEPKRNFCEAVNFLVNSCLIKFLSYFTVISTKFNYSLSCFQIFHQKMQDNYSADLLFQKDFFAAYFWSF